jgi:hypothetical protein
MFSAGKAKKLLARRHGGSWLLAKSWQGFFNSLT